MGLSNMSKNTPQIKVSFKIMSVGHMHLLNKNWGCFTGIKMLSYFIWNIRIPSNRACTANTLAVGFMCLSQFLVCLDHLY